MDLLEQFEVFVEKGGRLQKRKDGFPWFFKRNIVLLEPMDGERVLIYMGIVLLKYSLV